MSLAPSLSTEQSASNLDTRETSRAPGEEPSDANPPAPPADEIWRSQAGLLQLVSMLRDEFGDEENDELWAMATDFHDGDGEWEDEDEDEDEADHQHHHPHAHQGV